MIRALALGTCLVLITGQEVEADLFTIPGNSVVERKEFTCGRYSFVQDELRFYNLVQGWHSERGISSSISEIVGCRSYLAIIGMGEKAVPMIIAKLRDEGDDPDHWFVALEAITGQNPILEKDYGDTVKMASRWLAWAQENNVG